MSIALKAENVSIRYITGDFKDIGIKEYVVRHLTHNYHVNEFMAVDGVSFELESGDMLGIIGTNGAGKSTLLKAVAGIMEPTHGKITTEGEVAALLELGSGFDGDLTVKENAYLRGAMLGYTKAFMDETYDQIIDFAELREFEDRPFKQLSSGMKSRLAFSIASLVKPDILILDEVLSVGDGAFQEKSAKKMREIISQGATTILVSHSLGQIRELCNKVLWLDHGKQVAFGETQEICDMYERYLNGEYAIERTVPNASTEESNISCRSSHATKNFSLPKAAIVAAVLGFFAATVTYTGSENLARVRNEEEIIVIHPQELPVTYRGASINGEWYSPSDTVIQSDGWKINWDEVTITAKEKTILEVKLPKGSNRTITFNADQDQGNILVEVGGQTIDYDLSSTEAVPLGLPYDLPDTESKNITGNIIWSVLAFIGVFVLAMLLQKDKQEEKPTVPHEREVWGDVVRAACCFTIVLLHNTCNVFYGADITSAMWSSTLLVNSLTAFAVPCFYMISGAYLLRKDCTVRTALLHRVPKIYIPLIFWSCLYILTDAQIKPIQFFKMFYVQQTSHLWFVYSMVGIYILLPVLSKMYLCLDEKMKAYLVALLLFIPSLWHDLGAIAGVNLPNLHFAMFWPDLGLFFLGALLWDMQSSIQKIKWKFYALLFVTGLLINMGMTAYISEQNGTPNSTFISCIGSFGNLFMAVAILGGALAWKSKLQNIPKRMKNWILRIGEASMGIYFSHVLVMTCMSKFPLVSTILKNNTGTEAEMFISAVIYFLISFAISYCGHQVPVIKKVF